MNYGINLVQVQTVTVFALVIFALTLIFIGLYSTQKARTIDGFLLGSRKIGAWMSAFSYGTSYFSAVIFIGYAGKYGWNIGIGSLLIGLGNAFLGCLLSWLLLAKRTRNLTHELGAKTMPEFFEKRYNSKSMKVYSALIIFIFLVPYSAAVYKGLGSMFNVIFPSADVKLIMLILAVLSGIYLVLGGYVATSRTDFIQGVIMIVGVCIMMAMLLASDKVGGISSALSKLSEIGSKENVDLTSWFGGKNIGFLSINILLTSFGAWGLPQMVNKFYAIKSEKSVTPAAVISTGFCFIIGIGAYFVGTLGRIFLDNTMPEGGIDYIVPNTLLTALGDSNLFTTIILAVILLLLLSASMSTLSSISLTSASAVSLDLLTLLPSKAVKQKQVLITRLLCMLFVALSFIFAILNVSVIVNIMSFSWGVTAGCFIGPYIWGLYGKKTTKAGAWSGLLSGLITVIAITIFKTVTEGTFSAALEFAPTSGVIAMAVSVVIVPLVSLFTTKKGLDTK